MRTAKSDGVFISNSEIEKVNEEIGRLRFLLAQFECYGTKEKIQEKLKQLEKTKEEWKKQRICKNCVYYYPKNNKEGECEILSSCNYGKITKGTDTCPCCVIRKTDIF